MCRGRDVFAERLELNSVVSNCSFVHFAPNCSAFSRAREIPISGVRFPPLPIRSNEFPKGIPTELAKMPPAKKRKVEGDTCMAEMSADYCQEVHREGRGFGLEHPQGSIARELESWKTLERMEGVIATEYHTCMFEPSERRKAQVLIHNRPELADLIGRKCQDPKVCSRTGKPHKSWRPRVREGRVTSFTTGEEREYPNGFCAAYAKGMGRVATSVDGAEFGFLEIFSGPNAPLSSRVAEEFGCSLPPPAKSLASPDGKQIERVAADPKRENRPPLDKWRDSVLDKSAIKKPIPGPTKDEVSKYRREAIQSGRQPSYGGRTQLIPDGLNDPEKHLRRAKELRHPFESMEALKNSHEACLKELATKGPKINEYRLSVLENLRKEKKEMEWIQSRQNSKAAWTAKALGCKPNTALMRKLQHRLGLEDVEVPQLLEQGMGIIDDASKSPFFEHFEVPPKMSKEEYFGHTESRSEEMISRVRRMGQSADRKLNAAIYEKTQKEVTAGTTLGPFTLEDIRAKYRRDYQVVPSFGLAQGQDSQGNPKYRRIDDHTACGNNLVAHRWQKVPMAMVDYVSVLLRAEARIMGSRPILMSTEDMKGAYRQVPLLPAHVRYSITAVYNPHSDQVELFEMLGQPFGAGHAVPNFCRVAEWISRCLQKLYGMVVDHFFDDFFVIEPDLTIHTAMQCLRETFELLGFQLDPDKSQLPTHQASILGVVFNTENLGDTSSFRVEAKPSRITNLASVTQDVLESGTLSPALAASIVGKFGFLTSTLFGKAGWCCTGALRHRQYQNFKFIHITREIQVSLKLMQQFLAFTPPREVRVEFPHPLIMYTDASDVPERDPRFVVGACLYDPMTELLYYTSAPVPPSTVETWLPKQSYMGQLELLAAPFGLSTWQQLVKHRPIIVLIDNDSAASNLVKGYSPRLDSCAIVGHFWLMASHLQTMVYIDRVESKSNLADDPSRQRNDLLLRLGAIWTDPCLDSLTAPSTDPSKWFGTPFGGGN